ncbi:MAG: hypothetical protein ACYCTD_06045, partial [bacterium]
IAGVIMGLIVEFIIIILGRLSYGSLAIVIISLIIGPASYLFSSFLFKNESMHIIKDVLLKKTII